VTPIPCHWRRNQLLSSGPILFLIDDIAIMFIAAVIITIGIAPCCVVPHHHISPFTGLLYFRPTLHCRLHLSTHLNFCRQLPLQQFPHLLSVLFLHARTVLMAQPCAQRLATQVLLQHAVAISRQLPLAGLPAQLHRPPPQVLLRRERVLLARERLRVRAALLLVPLKLLAQLLQGAAESVLRFHLPPLLLRAFFGGQLWVG
jgi:hypothetical protein